MKTIIIYFDANKKNKQVIQPTDKFNGSALDLVEAITSSCHTGLHPIQNYHHYEVQ